MRVDVGVEVEELVELGERVEVGEGERSEVTVGLKRMERRGVCEAAGEPLSLEIKEEEDCELRDDRGERDGLKEERVNVPLVVTVPPNSQELNPREGEEEAVPKAPPYTPSGAMEVVGLPLWVG